MNQQILNYTFDASAKTVTFTAGTPILSQQSLITNVKQGVNTIIYQFNTLGKGGSLSGNVLTLEYDTTSMDDSDPLKINADFTDPRATEATLLTRLSESDFDVKAGSLTETAPASDTASSGLNGRLQRIAQRITSLISTLGTPFQAGGNIGNTSFGATQDGVWTVNTGLLQPLTDSELRASDVPVSLTTIPLATGAATSALQTQPGVDIGDVTVNNGAGVSAVNIQDGGNSITVDGPLTDAELRATPVAVSGTITSTPSGTQDVNLVSTIAVPVTDNGGTLTVDSVNLDIRDLTFISDKVDVSGSTITANLGTIAGISTEATLIQIRDYVDTVEAQLTSLISNTTGLNLQATQIQIRDYLDTVETQLVSLIVNTTGLSLEATQLLVLTALNDIKTYTDGIEALITSGNANLASIAAEDFATETTLASLSAKFANDYGVSSAAIRTASQIGNTTGAADFNAGATGTQTLRVTSNAGVNLNTSALNLETTQLLVKAKTDNLDVLLSTRASQTTLASVLSTQTDRTQFTKLTDGTNNATIKAASVLPVPTDTAIVVTQRDFQTGVFSNGTQTAVAAAAVQVQAVNANRKRLIVQNTGVANVRIGIAGVTSTTGVRLVPSGSIVFEFPFVETAAIFAIREGTVDSIILTQETT